MEAYTLLVTKAMAISLSLVTTRSCNTPTKMISNFPPLLFPKACPWMVCTIFKALIPDSPHESSSWQDPQSTTSLDHTQQQTYKKYHCHCHIKPTIAPYRPLLDTNWSSTKPTLWSSLPYCWPFDLLLSHQCYCIYIYSSASVQAFWCLSLKKMMKIYPF